jgi:Sec-independent protein translocase protein TatA
MLGPTGIIIGIGALVIGFIPKIVNSIKSLFGFTKDVNKEAAKGEKEAAKAEKLADKQDKKDISEELKPEDDVGDAPEPGTTPLEPPAKEFNKGGEVPGKGDKDTVPAMLTPGEFVMSKGAVEQYGVKTLEGMNAAAGGTNKPEEGIDSIKPMKGGGPVMPQTPMVRGYSGGGEVKPPEEVKVEDKKKQAPELNKETGKLAKRIEPLVTAQPPGMGGIGGALMSVAEKHPAVMLAKGIGKFIGKGMGKVGDMMKKKEPDLDLKEAIADLQKRFNYSIYDGNYKPQGGVVSEPKESGGGGSDPLAGFVSAVSTLPIVGKPLAKATGVLVSGVEKIIDDKLQLSGNQSGTATPDAPTKPTTTVAYQDAQAAAQGGGGGGGYSAGAGGKVPQFSASAKLSKQKIKVLGISR